MERPFCFISGHWYRFWAISFLIVIKYLHNSVKSIKIISLIFCLTRHLPFFILCHLFNFHFDSKNQSTFFFWFAIYKMYQIRDQLQQRSAPINLFRKINKFVNFEIEAFECNVIDIETGVIFFYNFSAIEKRELIKKKRKNIFTIRLFCFTIFIYAFILCVSCHKENIWWAFISLYTYEWLVGYAKII